MAQDSEIGWTDDTGNIWWGCTEVHEGCDHCYAKALDHRWSGNHWGLDRPRRAIKSIWKDFLRFQRLAQENGKPRKVFVGSMMDIAEVPMPIVDINGNLLPGNTGHLRDRFLNEVVPACPDLRFLLLTKRASMFPKVIPESWKDGAPFNVMFGTSVVNQKTADNLIPHLLKVKGYRFLSVEPQLDYIDLGKAYEGMKGIPLSGIDWVIVGGESGPGKRPFNPDWARYIRDVCKTQKVPFFMKQIDKVQPIPDDLLIQEFPKNLL